METRAIAPLYAPSTGTTAGTLLPSVTVSATTTATASTIFPGTLQNQIVQIQIANQSGQWAFVNFGVFGAVVAATVAASYPVGPGAVVTVSVASEVNGASVILGTGTGAVTFTRGEGL
jgi:hypothetical protein